VANFGGAEIARVRNGIAKVAFRLQQRATSISLEAQAHTAYGVCGVKVWSSRARSRVMNSLPPVILMMDLQTSAFARRAMTVAKDKQSCCSQSAPNRKAFKGRIHGNAKGGPGVNFGSFGLKAMEPERITAPDRGGPPRDHASHPPPWSVVDPDLPDPPVSSKPAEVRMGKGKGSPEFWVARQARPHPVRAWTVSPGISAKVVPERAAEKPLIRVKVVARLTKPAEEEK
jgi:large subunit ribosomal protein L16